MQKNLLFTITLFCCWHSSAQNGISTIKMNDSAQLIYWVECEASFPGGQGPMKRFLEKKYFISDSLLEKAGIKISGTIIAEFFIEKDGSLCDFEIVKSLNPVLDDEWLRVLKLMPKWSPAIQQGKLVKTKYKLSITIDIQE